MKKIVLLFVLIVLGCSSISAQRVAYKNDKNATLVVNNLLDENIVLFLGAVSKQNFLGGIQGGRERMLAIREKLSGNNGAVLIRAVKEDVFKKKKYNIQDEDVIFAQIIVYDKLASSDGSINVNGRVGGEFGVRIENNSPYALEIRLDKKTGDVLTTFSPHERARIVTMQYNSRGYTFFPTYIYYDANSKQMSSVTTQSLEGGQLMLPVDITGDLPILSFRGPSEADKLVHPVAYVTFINQAKHAAIFSDGATERKSQKGNEVVNPGTFSTYEMEIAGYNADSMLFTSLGIGIGGSTPPRKIDPVTLKKGFDYTLYYIDNGGSIETRIVEGGKRSFDLDGLLQLANENN